MTTTKLDGPCILIAGAGLGGLLLGALLEKAGMEYHIFERATKVKPLGSAMTLGPTILPALEQLGLLEELKKISKPIEQLNIANSALEPIASLRLQAQRDMPEFYELIRRQIPEHKVHFGKRILQVKEKEKDEHGESKVIIQCSDNTDYDGDILVGADGAYSSVRQNIYRELEAVGQLPKSDKENLVAGSTCIVGVTNPLDPEKYPQVKEPLAQHMNVLGPDSRMWSVYTVPSNRVCWGLSVRFEDPEEAKRQQFANSEWGPEALAPALKELADKPCPFGGTMGDLIELTPKDYISKVFLEHKMFETWYHGRSVLLGDACHKMLPAAGLGAVNAMQDAVILANCLYDLKDSSRKNITICFQNYYNQRYPHAKAAYEKSLGQAKFMSGQRWYEKVIRQVVLNLPAPIWESMLAKTSQYRPQIAFLETIPFRGTGTTLPLVPSERYQKEQEEAKKNKPSTK
ncbi:hypothetical protein BGZ83_007317 [Gryganskiella cystojenkinii]|nr:hypothetical protein BGZ83_007317 [Gryganskiella cystojenkinii]